MSKRLEIELPSTVTIHIEPTISMRRGEQQVFQCAQCGTVVVQPSTQPGKLGTCPSCGDSTHGWVKQDLPVAGLRKGAKPVDPIAQLSTDEMAVQYQQWVDNSSAELRQQILGSQTPRPWDRMSIRSRALWAYYYEGLVGS